MTNNTPDYEDNLYFDCKNCKMTDEYCASGDCNSQNTKNEQQKDLCITSEQLTEQFDNDKITKGSYYCKSKLDGHICIAGFISYKGLFDCNYNGTLNKGYWEILAPVPSYDEWKSSDKLILTLMDNIKEKSNLLQLAMVKNAQLKETVEALESELKEVCDVLIRKCPEMKEWVMLNWKNLYEVKNDKTSTDIAI